MKNIFLIVFLIVFCALRNSALSDQPDNKPSMQSFLSEYYQSPQKNQKGYSKLLYAVEKDYRNIAVKLLESGEDPNYLSLKQNNPTPFLLAVYKEDFELVSKMIHKGAQVNLKAQLVPDHGIWYYPLDVAVANNKSEEITQLLCDSGAQIINPNCGGWTHPLVNACHRGDAPKFFILARLISEVDLKKLDSIASCLLLAFAIRPNSLDKKNNTIQIAQYLIEKGMSLENECDSALARAITCGNKELVELLISAGANINYVPKTKGREHQAGNNPLFAAILYCEQRRSSDKNNLVNTEFIASDMELLDLLLDLGVEVNFCLPRYIHPYQHTIIWEGFSPLAYSICHQLNDIANLLISYGADVNMIDSSRKTPLICAVEAKNPDGVKLLLASGATPTKAGLDGKSPIEVAHAKGYFEILDILIEAESRLFN